MTVGDSGLGAAMIEASGRDVRTGRPLRNKLLCIYHAHCDDGFAAVWAVRQALGDGAVEFHEGVYGQDPPDVTGRRVLLVDFSYKHDVLQAMAAVADGVLVLDHHKTAQADLADLPEPPDFASWRSHVQDGPTAPQWTHLAAVFDMDRSGAGLAWDYLFPSQRRPLFIDYVEDRDLWRKTLPGTEEFTAGLRSYPQDFETWNRILVSSYGETEEEQHTHGRVKVKELITEGTTVLRYYRARVDELKANAYLAHMPGLYDGELNPLCACVNAGYAVASDLANEVIDLFPAARFGVVFFQEHPHAWKYSLRSRDGLMDVSAIAARWGGGGHRNAAGFTVGAPIHDAL